MGEFNNQQLLHLKGSYNIKSFSLDTLVRYNIQDKLLQKNDIKVEFNFRESHFLTAQLETDGLRNYRINYKRLNSYFDILKLSYIHRFTRKHWAAGMQVNIPRFSMNTT